MTRLTMRMAVAASAVGLLVVGVAGGYWWALRAAGPSAPLATVTNERTVLYWYDPMVPDQRFDKPGKSPFMDMALVPKYADEVPAGGVRIDAGVQQNVGIRTATVEVGRLATAVRVPGTLAWDLRLESIVSTRVDGIVTRVLVKAPFTRVRRGEPLASVLSPSWASALAEAEVLDDAQSASARELRSAASQRLRILGVERGADRDGGATMSAPIDGVVTEVLVRDGQAVIAGAPLFRVNGTATLWLEAAIPQAVIAGLASGAAVTAQINGDLFSGTVEALLPQIDLASRTQRARIVLPNPDGTLVPGMFAEVVLQSDAGAPLPLVPTDAIIATGEDSRVIVVGSGGAFEPVRVRTGGSGDGRTEILSGLTGGERIVVSGQFLIDSEANLSSALERLGSPVQPEGQP